MPKLSFFTNEIEKAKEIAENNNYTFEENKEFRCIEFEDKFIDALEKELMELFSDAGIDGHFEGEVNDD